MGPVHDRPAFQQRVAGKPLGHFQVRCGFPSVPGIHAYQAEARRVRSQFCIDCKCVLRRAAASQRQINPVRLLRAQLIGQRDQRGLVFRQQNHAAGLEIEPVCVGQIAQLPLLRPRRATRDAAMQQGDQIGSLRVVTIRRSQQAARLVQRQQPGVLPQHRDWPEFAGFRCVQFENRVARFCHKQIPAAAHERLIGVFLLGRQRAGDVSQT